MSASRSTAAARLSASRRAPEVTSPVMPRLGTRVRECQSWAYSLMPTKSIRVAAAGDIHASAGEERRVHESFRRVEERADVIVLAGDLTQHGQLDEVAIVADACRELSIPTVTVLGNHDWQSDRPGDLTSELVEAGVVGLDPPPPNPTDGGAGGGVPGA